MLATLIFSLLLVQQLPEGVPHPSHPLYAAPGQAPLEGALFNDRPVWCVISTAWLPEAGAAGFDDVRADFARVEGARMGLTADDVAAWYLAHGMQQVGLRYELRSGGQSLLSGEEQVQLGRAADVADRAARSVVLDLDVEIASVSAIADPIIGRQWAGRTLAVRLLPIPGTGWLAECALVDTRPLRAGRIETGNADIPPLERLASDVVEAECSLILLPGSAGIARFPGPDGAPLELQLEALAAAPPDSAAYGSGTWFDASALLADGPAWRRFADDWRASGMVFVDDASGVMVFDADDPRQLAQLAADALRAAMRPLAVEVHWSVERNGEEIARHAAQVTTPAGRAVRFAQGSLTRVLADWDVEVALGSRIPDPVFADLLGGVRCVARAVPAGDAYQVDLDLEFTAVALGEPQELLLAAPSAAQDSGDGQVPAAHEQRVKVDQAAVARSAFRGSYRTDVDGLLVLERSAAQVFGEGARVRIEVRVTGD